MPMAFLPRVFNFPGTRVRALLTSAEDHDLGAGLRQSGGHGSAEDSAAANHYRHLAGQ